MQDKIEHETRKYTRLAESQWAACEALWESGDATLAELADRYGVAVRTLQARFERRGIVKGSTAQMIAADVRERITAEHFGNPGDLASRALAIREATVRNVEVIERLTMAQLDAVQADPGLVFKAASAIKMLSLAAATLERTNAIKRTALGLDAADIFDRELPVLIVRNLTQGEIEAIQRGDDGTNDDDIIDNSIAA